MPFAYELLDFGSGRKLERFGNFLIDRPAPAAEGLARSQPRLWTQANARYERTSGQTGRWLPAGGLPESWPLACGDWTLELRPTPFGHLGVFPEQAENWRWIAQQIAAMPATRVKTLNLFAYTGGATLACAAAGAEVAHIDSARNVVAWARRNAALSRLDDRPIRWIAEDAAKFVAREVRRGNRYDALILDPPSYGHGPQGQVWKLSEQLPELLAQCAQLTGPTPALLVLTCHSPDVGPGTLSAWLGAAGFNLTETNWTFGELSLTSADGRRLSAGVAARGARPQPGVGQ